ncbi:MAG: hypothetical protein NTZ26_07110 [Candidatus Aminicenantes bacterium]|nr:hypothetical protein [Candidatus Aminicenantes bacterium]
MRFTRRRPAKPAAILLLMALGSLAAAPFLSAKIKYGVRIEVVKMDGSELVGELIAVRKATMVVADFSAGSYEFIEMADIRIVRIPKISKALGAFNGFIQGAFYGAVIGGLTAGDKNPTSKHWSRAFIGGTIGAAAMSVLGGIKGKPTKDLEVIQIKDQSPENLAVILEGLSKMARVKNAS